MKVLYCRRPGRLLWVIHHLAVDGVSWRILLEDFQRAYAGQALPARTASFQQWARRLETYARSEEVMAGLDYWEGLWENAPAALPADFPGGSNLVASADSVSVELEEDETEALLKDVPPVYRTHVNDVLLAALGEALAGWTGSDSVVMDLEGHGREEIADDLDLSRTVGWFTALFPVRLEIPRGGGPGELLKAVKEQLRAVPNRGLGYGLLRYLGDEEARSRLASQPAPEVVFNYLGQFDEALAQLPAGYRPAREPRGPERSPAARRSHSIEVNGGIAGGRLRVQWTYSRALHSRETVQRVGWSFVDALRRIIEHCRAPEAGGVTPSDFPLAGLDQRGLDRLLSKIR
ncbi:MAG: hypothetical protein IT158_22430 [Bryobacterales bacterium]|nr:hypothetical protein [Bryobacterales bacterium]